MRLHAMTEFKMCSTYVSCLGSVGVLHEYKDAQKMLGSLVALRTAFTWILFHAKRHTITPHLAALRCWIKALQMALLQACKLQEQRTYNSFFLSGDIVPVGNQTECALLGLSQRLGADFNGIQDSHEEVLSLPFSSERKRMTTVVNQGRSRCAVRLHLFSLAIQKPSLSSICAEFGWSSCFLWHSMCYVHVGFPHFP